MAWETRARGGRYYTRSSRVNGRVTRQYLGGGQLAGLIARWDELDRQKRDEARREAQEARQAWNAQEAAVRALCASVEGVLRHCMELAGYHRHRRGAWRKRRGGEGMAARQTQQAKEMAAALTREQEIRAAGVPEDRAERSGIIRMAINGDKALESRALACLRKHPGELWLGWGNPKDPVMALCGPNQSPVLYEVIAQEYDAKLKQLAGPDPTPLESILAERVVVCRMQLASVERSYAAHMKAGMTFDASDHDQKRIDRAQKRLLSAVKALAQVRKLQLPTVQVNIGQQQNIAEKQVNVLP